MYSTRGRSAGFEISWLNFQAASIERSPPEPMPTKIVGLGILLFDKTFAELIVTDKEKDKNGNERQHLRQNNQISAQIRPDLLLRKRSDQISPQTQIDGEEYDKNDKILLTGYLHKQVANRIILGIFRTKSRLAHTFINEPDQKKQERDQNSPHGVHHIYVAIPFQAVKEIIVHITRKNKNQSESDEDQASKKKKSIPQDENSENNSKISESEEEGD